MSTTGTTIDLEQQMLGEVEMGLFAGRGEILR